MTREEAALKHFEMLARALETGNYYDDFDEIDDYINIEDLYVAIEALQERPKGRWVGEVIHTEIGEEHAMQECSVCGKVRIVDNYCPNCGSDNRGEEE